MKLAQDIDLGRSLRKVFGNDTDSTAQIEHDRSRQTAAGNAILQRFFARKVVDRRELTILADEVGLGKTYVALAVAVSILDAIRNGEAPEELPASAPTLEIAVPYLAATYDERMFEELYRRAQLFEVTLGGDMRVDGRVEPENVEIARRRREALGIGTEDEDLGEESGATDSISLPEDMVERLRVDLSVWRPDCERK